MIITPNFNSSEFFCHDGTSYPDIWIEERLKPLCEALEVIRTATGGPLHILSGYRTPEHNKKVGGKAHSQHLEGRAADIASRKMDAKALAKIILFLIANKKLLDGGLGSYNGFVHYDLGPSRRWHG